MSSGDYDRKSRRRDPFPARRGTIFNPGLQSLPPNSLTMIAIFSPLSLRIAAVLWLAATSTMPCVSSAPPSSTRYGSHETSSESKSRGPPAHANRHSKPVNFKVRELETLLAQGKELPESVAELYSRVLEPSHEDSLNLQGRRRTELMKPAQQSTTGAINSRETALQRILRKLRQEGVSAPPSSTRGERRAMSSSALSRSREHRAQGGKISSAGSRRGKHWARMKLTESEEKDVFRLVESKELPKSIARRFLRVLQTSVRLSESEVEEILSLAENRGLPESIAALFLGVLETLASDSVEMDERRPQFRTGRRASSGVDFTDKAIQQETATEGGGPHSRLLEIIGVSNVPFQFVDSNVLTFRGNLLPSSSHIIYPEGGIHFVQPSSVDESIFFLSEKGVWRLPTTSTSYGAGSVSRAAGPFYDAQAFTIVDMSKYGRQGRFLLVAEADDDSLRTVSLDSYEPPFGIRYMTGLNSEILSLAVDPSRPYVYFSTEYGIFKMYLPSSGTGSVVPLIDEGSAIGSVEASIPGDAGFDRVRVSQHAFSADGQFMYVADLNRNAVYRVWMASGEVENIGSGYVDVDVYGPYGLALTSDGCNLFVSEYVTGRITLITFERSGGLVRSIRTLAGRSSGRYTESSIDLFGLAISPDDSYLYVGAYEAIYKFEIDTWDLPSCSPISSSSPPSVPPTIRPIISTSSPPPVISVPQPSGNTFPGSTATPTRSSTTPLPPDPPSPISFSYPPPSTSTPPPPSTSTPLPQFISNSSSAKKQTDLTPVVIALGVVLPVVGAALGVLMVWCLCGIQRQRRRRREAESRAIDRPVPSIDAIDARARSQQIEPVAFTNNPTGAGNWWQGPAGGGTFANNRHLDAVPA
ncbi:hypothetical protein CBR_g1192 [Chara braunii]|uniref:SMP-30/Gluconolactonase/LRE-like region domain-containing protein n=1 Tax=Chara braunii TaxID=69332 RepID=A0A388KDG3_CHABU|nr:hypothetical protein CBR_g1192 [Chara braunii]|eukprot:GBG68071.1 hypothetical protein CBR_g1192 [Chara braunii]